MNGDGDGAVVCYYLIARVGSPNVSVNGWGASCSRTAGGFNLIIDIFIIVFGI